MKRFIAVTAAPVTVALPATAAAKPDQVDRKNAAQECRFERGNTTASREAFRTYGTNRNKRNAFGKCVSRRAKDEESERRNAARNAAQECKDERAANPQLFQTYGTNANYNNAFGKCVSSKAKAKKDEADARDAEQAKARRRAARACAAERRRDGRQAFAQKHGTNRNKRNAFLKCVSKRAKAA
ncbi:MAG TPA: hypothetical protein VFD31_00690 [Thermoleophilaceae bacterium]|nr:hypothetical protein [Thermoleophilaceae bacterium]